MRLGTRLCKKGDICFYKEVYGANVERNSLTKPLLDIWIAWMHVRVIQRASVLRSLLKSYSLQYGVDFNSVRIAHTYGTGMKLENDGRVMSDLLKLCDTRP